MHGKNEYVPRFASDPAILPSSLRQLSCRVPTETADEGRLTASPLNRAQSVRLFREGRTTVPGSQISAASLPSGRLSGHCTFSSQILVLSTLREESAWMIGGRKVLFRPQTLMIALSWRMRLLWVRRMAHAMMRMIWIVWVGSRC
jgi:hypothetical protein